MATDDSYLEPVRPAVEELNQLYSNMLEQLDAENLSFGWWHGYADIPRLALISEYLVASVWGLRESLIDSAHLLSEWKKYTYADEEWARKRLRLAAEAGATEDRVFVYLRRTGVDARRDLNLRLGREHIVYHLAQAMDRLAAVVVGVSALKAPILRADWQLLADAKRFAKVNKAQPDPGLAAQVELRRLILGAVDRAGPEDWLDWLDGMRNTNAHRAPKLHMMLATDEGRRAPSRLIQLFEKQSTWSMTEAMVAGSGSQIGDVWLVHDPASILDGAVASVGAAVEEAARLVGDLWERRRKDPLLLVQLAEQWPKVMSERELAFEGYGSPVNVRWDNKTIRVSPENGLRMQASGLFNLDIWKT